MKGFICAVLDKRGGTSARTGNAWAVQSFVLQTEEQYPKHLCFEVFGEDKLKQFDIKLNEKMTVYFDVDAREYQGKWFPQLRAWKVEKEGGRASDGIAGNGGGTGAAVNGNGGGTGAAVNGNGGAAGAVANGGGGTNGETVGNGGDGDDLPF